MKTKVCRVCRVRRLVSRFTSNSETRDKLDGRCKPCKAAQERARPPEPKRAAVARWKAANPERSRELDRVCNLAYADKHPQRRRALRALNRALKFGEVQRQPCFVCGNLKVDAHHASYAKDMWLVVTWLCRIHHIEIHRKYRS